MPPTESPSHRIHRTTIQMRFSDTDALGHLNNGAYAVYAEVARLEFLGLLADARRSLILARLEVDFRRQVRFGEAIEVTTWIERVGTTSVTMRHEVLADGTMAAEVRAVVVSFDYDAQRPKPWTDAQRTALQPYVSGGDSATARA